MTTDAITAPEPTSTAGAPPPPPPPPGRDWRAFPRRHPVLTALYGVLAFIGVLILALVIFLWLANWNMLRGPIGRYASAQTHRHIEIDGDLKVHLLTLTPTVSIGGLKIGNPAWAGAGDTADVDRIVAQVRLWPLFTGRVVMPLLQFDKPVLNLYRDASGRANWDLGPSKPNAKPFKLPPIERFVVNQGHLKYVDIPRKLNIAGVIDSNEKAGGSGAHAFSLIGQGALNRKPFHLNVSGGPLLHVQLDKPYPFTADVTAVDTHITASGQLSKPFDLGNYTTNLHLTGKDLFDLYYLTGLALPNTPPYDIRGVLSHSLRQYDFDKAAGRIGDSDVEGGLKVKLSVNNRPDVIATLSSRLLDFKDLATLFGAKPVSKAEAAAVAKPGPVKVALNTAPVKTAPATASQRLLPDSTLAVGALRSLDATVHYHALAVRSAFLPLRQANLEMTLDHGVLTVNPVAFSFPQGRFSATARLDASGAVPVTDVDMRLSNLDLQEFVPHAAGALPPVEGVLAARAKLHGVGDSVHKAAASSSGAVTFVIPQGKIRTAFAELLGVNAGRGLRLLLSKNQDQSNVRCAIADFTVQHGVMQARQVVFDTDVVTVNGKGDIDLGPESIDLTLSGDTKKFSLTHVFLPITIGGHLKSPALGVQVVPAAAQLGAAVALGAVLTPLAAVLPFVDPGLGKNADCAALMTTAQTTAAPVKASQGHGLITTPAVRK